MVMVVVVVCVWIGWCGPQGMLSKRRQLVLTDSPRLFYIDPQSLAVMGEIPWSKDLKPQYKSNKLFFVHTVSCTNTALPCTDMSVGLV